MISKINKLIPDELVSYICSFIDHSDVRNKFLNIDRFIPIIIMKEKENIMKKWKNIIGIMMRMIIIVMTNYIILN